MEKNILVPPTAFDEKSSRENIDKNLFSATKKLKKPMRISENKIEETVCKNLDPVVFGLLKSDEKPLSCYTRH